jgi:hypothetical protein
VSGRKREGGPLPLPLPMAYVVLPFAKNAGFTFMIDYLRSVLFDMKDWKAILFSREKCS